MRKTNLSPFFVGYFLHMKRTFYPLSTDLCLVNHFFSRCRQVFLITRPGISILSSPLSVLFHRLLSRPIGFSSTVHSYFRFLFFGKRTSPRWFLQAISCPRLSGRGVWPFSSRSRIVVFFGFLLHDHALLLGCVRVRLRFASFSPFSGVGDLNFFLPPRF